VKDGGRDVLAVYRVGHDDYPLALEVCAEAKRWDPDAAMGVRPMMRLISRLKHRDFGIFVTTSYFEDQVQKELIADGHPVVLIAGGDIAKILNSNDKEGEALELWLQSIRNQEDA
jgi:Restriction endonuclease